MSDETLPAAADDALPEAPPVSEATSEVVDPQVARGRRWAMAIICCTTLLLFAGFFVAEPLLKQLVEPMPRRPALVQPSNSLLVQQRALEALTGAWFFMLGASLGSFLHCLEYRWPRKISVVARGSACPQCQTPIHLWHNVPVFGWLWLRGRCARCGWDIPPRYALTELAFGTVFVLLLWLELVGSGMNLPFVRSGRPLGVIDNIWDPHWPLLGFFAYHAALMTFLLAFSLFAWDRFGLPLLLVGFAVLLGITMPLVWPFFQPVGWDGLTNVLPATSRLRIAAGLVAGGLAGLVLGNALVRRTPGNIRAGDVAATIGGMLLVGLYLGWQAALAIGVLTVVVRAAFWISGARSWPVVAAIAVATLLHLLAWRWLTPLPVYPGLHGQIWATLAAMVLVPLLAAWLDGIEQGGDAGPTIVAPPSSPDVAPLSESSMLSEI